MILVLGGTAEARALASRTKVTSSLAGRVSNPRMPEGEVRVGGFGGVDGLVSYLTEHAVEAVVDATHPFAANISGNAVAACRLAGVPLLRLSRPGWSHLPQAGRWHWVDTHQDAARVAASLGTRTLLTTGRQTLHVFAPVLTQVVARVVEPAVEDATLPEGWLLVLDRGPYTLEGELDLLREHHIDVLVTKDSGGDFTRPKLDAADQLGLEVVVVRRPPPHQGVDEVATVDEAVTWLERSAAGPASTPRR